jgi:hypothetical protein
VLPVPEDPEAPVALPARAKVVRQRVAAPVVHPMTAL